MAGYSIGLDLNNILFFKARATSLYKMSHLDENHVQFIEVGPFFLEGRRVRAVICKKRLRRSCRNSF